MTEAGRGHQGPSSYTWELAQVTDDHLTTDIRTAVIAVTWWCDAWWADTHATAERYDQHRKNLVDHLHAQTTALGATATVDELLAAARPLLGAFWPTYPASATHLAAAVELLRDVVMNRAIWIKTARAEVSAWSEGRQAGRL